MNNVLNQLGYYFSFPFVRYAMMVGILIALCSALFGVILVLKRFSFLGDGLSHTAFGALAIATVLRVSNEIYIVLPVTAILAVVLLKKGRNAKVKGDAALAMMSVGTLAIGYMILNIFPGSKNVAGDVCSTLFGATSILTLDKTDVWVCAVFAGLVIALFAVFYNRIFAVTFDENFSISTGIDVDRYKYYYCGCYGCYNSDCNEFSWFIVDISTYCIPCNFGNACVQKLSWYSNLQWSDCSFFSCFWNYTFNSCFDTRWTKHCCNEYFCLYSFLCNRKITFRA